MFQFYLILIVENLQDYLHSTNSLVSNVAATNIELPRHKFLGRKLNSIILKP